ncbi:hypothetical protein C8F04DRAFT_1269857 [Mycena alexandri]|uniref:Uncharacterized protein n=1 Tax=Mycena alexandri TaxID=1745969 RepID=A0AAD6SDR6_9AGAR|nr:hypothetical protein C8F04DRAFT_1269857 [Mycena alexandri]
MSKPRSPTSRPKKGSDAYRPGLTAAEKKERRRKVSAAYYARAAVKAKRRQWDLVKAPPRTLTRSSGSLHLELVPAELLYGVLRFEDGRGASTSEGEDSAFKRMDARRRIGTETSEVNLAPESVGARPDEQAALEALAMMAHGPIGSSPDSILQKAHLLSSEEEYVPPRDLTRDCTPPPVQEPSRRVRLANAAVAELNSVPLTQPTPIEARNWVRRTFGFYGVFLQSRQHTFIDNWRKAIH